MTDEQIRAVPAEDAARRVILTRKARDAAFALPVIGAVLILPPVARVFDIDAEIAGVPLVVAYIFVIWIVLIGVARHVSRLVAATETDLDREP